jgi:hypothetical protein
MNDVELVHTAIASLWKSYGCAEHAHERQQVLQGLKALTEAVGEAEFCTPEQFTEWHANELKLARNVVGAR